MTRSAYFNLNSTIKSYPKHPYREIKEAILGKEYDLSLNFIGRKRAERLNRDYRQKTYAPNVLSFPLTPETGEIFICPEVALPEAAEFHLTPTGYVGFLFIHGLLHLKGYDHGATMEKLERQFCKRFSIA